LDFSGGGITNPATSESSQNNPRISSAGNAAAAALPATLASRTQELGFVSTIDLLLVASQEES
jgi:hypothetical protein